MKDKEETEQRRWGETSDCNTGLTPVKGEREAQIGRASVCSAAVRKPRQADGAPLSKGCPLEGPTWGRNGPAPVPLPCAVMAESSLERA